ncbi:hypothetical protein Leryth_001092 [Lithospermum erythrorhizon]|nr:hypothetical protein Leryth_001092 [Lithospermum erythrorhizon]
MDQYGWDYSHPWLHMQDCGGYSFGENFNSLSVVDSVISGSFEGVFNVARLESALHVKML